MTKAAQQLLQQVLALDEADQVELVDSVYESLGPSTDPEYIAAWGVEIERRIKQLQSGEEVGIPWREALEQVRRGEVDQA
jgi:hypothetical protein